MLNLIKCRIGNIRSIKNTLNTINIKGNSIERPSEINHEFKNIILSCVGSFDSFVNSLNQVKLFSKNV